MVKDKYKGKYEQHIVAIFREKIDGEYSTSDEEIDFDRDDIDKGEEKYDLERIRNPSDLSYQFRGRGNLPRELSRHGYDSVIINIESGRSDAAYLITKRKQIIDLPEIEGVEQVDTSDVPELVNSYTADNEQGVLTLVRYINLIPEFIGVDECYHLQDHLRTSGIAGQIEVDGLYIAEKNGEHLVILVEGKDEDEEFTRNQLAINTKTIEKKEGFPDTVISLGVQSHGNGIFSVLEFDIPKDRNNGMVQIKRFQHYTSSQLSLNSF